MIVELSESGQPEAINVIDFGPSVRVGGPKKAIGEVVLRLLLRRLRHDARARWLEPGRDPGAPVRPSGVPAAAAGTRLESRPEPEELVVLPEQDLYEEDYEQCDEEYEDCEDHEEEHDLEAEGADTVLCRPSTSRRRGDNPERGQ